MHKDSKQDTLSTHALTKSFSYGETVLTVLHHVSTHFNRGNSYAITGVSGTGKSTLLHLLAGIEPPTNGTVYFNNADINQFSEEQKANFLHKTVGLVFQSPYLINELTIAQNVAIKGMIAGQSFTHCRSRALQLLTLAGLTDKADWFPTRLSGGQQQRVAIMRALYNNPLFLLADEPTGNLDKKNSVQLINLLQTCQKEFSMGVIISSHDTFVAQQMDTVLHLEYGTLTTISNKNKIDTSCNHTSSPEGLHT